jgi:hypothetical protein
LYMVYKYYMNVGKVGNFRGGIEHG